MEGGYVRGRPRLGWLDGVKVALRNREMAVEAGVNVRKIEKVESPLTYETESVSRGHFCMALCYFGPPSRALVVVTWRGVAWRIYDAVSLNCKKSSTTENLIDAVSIWTKGYMLMIACVCVCYLT